MPVSDVDFAGALDRTFDLAEQTLAAQRQLALTLAGVATRQVDTAVERIDGAVEAMDTAVESVQTRYRDLPPHPGRAASALPSRRPVRLTPKG